MRSEEAPAYNESYVSELSFIERYGLRYLKNECPGDQTNIDPWSKEQVDKINRLERRTLLFAALSGAISGGIIAGVELALRTWLVDDVEASEWREMIPYYAANLAFVGIITVIEIIFLYWLVIGNVARMACIGHLGLGNRPDDVLTLGITRAAMDMPNPQTQFYGIDPYRRISGWKLWFYAFAYRAKVGATSIILRMMMRRVLARAAVRSIIPLVAIPLYALWNIIICRWIIREARGRAVAPIAIHQFLERLEDKQDTLKKDDHQMLITMIAETIMRTIDSHPSYLLLLSQLLKKFDLDPESLDLDFEWKNTCERLADLDTAVQDMALEVVLLSVVLDGKPTSRQRRLVLEVFSACNREFKPYKLNRLYAEFINGQGFSKEYV